MSDMVAKKINSENYDTSAAVGTRVGRIVSIDKSNAILVTFQGNPYGPLPARSTVHFSEAHDDQEVVLVFENSDLQRPIIVGLVQDQSLALEATALGLVNRKDIVDITVDGERLILDAKMEIEIRCGRSALIMKPDGKVIIKGDNLVSRARRTNKIRGAAVRIN